jgi:histidyl-tRNA synthetase
VIVVAEDDSVINWALQTSTMMRAKGFSAEVVATGSPRKRYDKAVKLGAKVIYSLSSRDGEFSHRAKGDEAIIRQLDAAFLEIVSSNETRK